MIDIPYGHYCTIKDGFLSECLQATTEAILNGTLIPDNATNGDMIKVMFPQLKIRILPDMVIVFGEDYEFQHHYPIEWWNSPYKRGETDE